MMQNAVRATHRVPGMRECLCERARPAPAQARLACFPDFTSAWASRWDPSKDLNGMGSGSSPAEGAAMR